MKGKTEDYSWSPTLFFSLFLFIKDIFLYYDHIIIILPAVSRLI